MNEDAMAGALLVVAGVVLAYLWWRGYLTDWLAKAASYVQNPPAKNPLTYPGTGGPRPIAV